MSVSYEKWQFSYWSARDTITPILIFSQENDSITCRFYFISEESEIFFGILFLPQRQ